MLRKDMQILRFPVGIPGQPVQFQLEISHPQRGGHLRNTKKVDQMFLCVRYISLLFTDWNSASMPFKSILLATSMKAD